MATLKKKILFIGFGNLAKSILNKDFNNFYKICKITSNKKLQFINYKRENVIDFNVVFLLVKPNIFYKFSKDFLKFINKNTVVISFMAGVKTKTISNKLNHYKVVRVMPSVLALNQKSHTSIFSKNIKMSKWVANNITNFFGTSFILKNESDMHKATVLFGSGPAYIAYIINSYIGACNQFGNYEFTKNDSIQDMFKSVLNYSSNFGGFDNFIKSISSKKGITQEGIKYLKSNNTKKIIYSALMKSYKKSRELSIDK